MSSAVRCVLSSAALELIQNSLQQMNRRKKNVKKDIHFSLTVRGASDTGRTTFVNMLCGSSVLAHKELDDESGAHANFSKIVGHLERHYDDHLAEESRIKRNPRFRDNRVHAMLFFITPTGHGLRELDIELMKRLAPRVNLAQTKKLIMEDIEHYRIPIYSLPCNIEEDDEETIEENAELRGLMPFAIVGSKEVVEISGRKVRARQYPWGIVEVDNHLHSDFLAIR
ncbi:Cell division control protein 11 [Neonectria magnoliae]|uniref:Cell division control protein 11 n=1 Tax=Neonectria magnoliae TaxID=2732573 RepID=A0ABR1I5M0_9HYPO